MHHRWTVQVVFSLSMMLLSPTLHAEESRPSLDQVKSWLIERGGDRTTERLQILADYHSPRLNGSEALESAFAWAEDILRGDGLSNVVSEPVMVPHWTRGHEEASIVTPVERPLHILGLGGAPGTQKPVEGELAVFPSVEAMKLASPQHMKGKVILINRPLPPYDSSTGETHYGQVGKARIDGPAEASRLGASAVLVRSITSTSLATPHTGMTRFPPGVTPIPSAAVTLEDADRLVRLLQQGPVTIRMSMGAEWHPDFQSQNLIAEIPGTEQPDEVVLVGAHLDTWDVGDGSMDNGCGCIMVMEAVRLLLRLPVRPRRTIRLVLFTDEEHQQRGAEHYYKHHGEEAHVAAVEADLGCGIPRGYTVQGEKEDVAFLRTQLPLFSSLGIETIKRGGAGADIAPLVKRKGIMGVGIAPDASTYFQRHHSAADTFDKVPTQHLITHARGLALLLYVLAERGMP